MRMQSSETRKEAQSVDQVVEVMLAARTPQEIDKARKLAQDWLKRHPEDEERILSAGEQLEMMADIPR